MSTEQARNEPRTAAGQALRVNMEDWLRGQGLNNFADQFVAAILAIEREAIADFLDHDLPGLLAEAIRGAKLVPEIADEEGVRGMAEDLIAAIRQRIAERQP